MVFSCAATTREVLGRELAKRYGPDFEVVVCGQPEELTARMRALRAAGTVVAMVIGGVGAHDPGCIDALAAVGTYRDIAAVMKNRRSKIPPQKTTTAYRSLWRVIDGAVADAFAMHPEYLAAGRERDARASVVKRVTGAVLGFADQISARGRVGKPAG